MLFVVSRGKTMTVDAAEAALRAIAERGLPTVTRGGRGPLGRYARADWQRYRAMLGQLPDGVDPGLVANVLHLEAYELAHLATLAPHLDTAIVSFLDAQAKRGSPRWRFDCVFVTTALAAAQGDRHQALQRLIRLTTKLQPVHACKPGEHARLIAAHPEVVAGAQAAVAVTPAPVAGTSVGGQHFGRSKYVAILAADASRESLDILVPLVEDACKSGDERLDWLLGTIAPQLRRTEPALALMELLAGVAEERGRTSPALAFAESLGMKPPPQTLQFTLTFRGRAGKTARSRAIPAFQIKVDSTRADWFTGRRANTGSWVSYELDLDMLRHQFAARPVEYSLRIHSSDADRAKIAAWADRFLRSA